jgi:hypothetical protein
MVCSVLLRGTAYVGASCLVHFVASKYLSPLLPGHTLLTQYTAPLQVVALVKVLQAKPENLVETFLLLMPPAARNAAEFQRVREPDLPALPACLPACTQVESAAAWLLVAAGSTWCALQSH